MTSKSLTQKPLRQVQTVQDLLKNDMAKSQLQMVAARHLSPERMMRLMANAVRTTPALQNCDPLSLLGSMMTCASLGLEPNTMLGHVFVIPFKNKSKGITEVNLVLGYKGMIDLARRSGAVVSIHADVVYEADEFSFEYGSNQHLKHVPAGDRQGPTHAYCHAKLIDGEAFIVLPYTEVLKVRDSSQGYKAAIRYGKKDNPWIAYEHQMARKTAVRALFNELPISVEKVSDALQVDESQANFADFALNPEQGAPQVGQIVDAEAQPEPEGAETKESPAEEKPDQKAKEPPSAKSAEPSHDPTDKGDSFDGLVKLVADELQAASDIGAVEAVMEIYGPQISEAEGTDSYDKIMEAADDRREELANG